MADVKLRPNQKKILRYRRGKMGISAVPGSGKTWTLSRLAAQIVRNGVLDDEQEVLVVTLVNSAVDNFSQRVSQFLGETSLLPNLGYRVRTLHGLAHDIVRERPALVGLADNFQIIDEREAESIRNDVARAWLQVHPYDLDSYLDPEMEEGKTEWVRRE
jgi:DNA helicase-2/ATP-dependent DNA helicase PcrA